MTNSRFITYPSTVEKESNTTIVLVDADMDDIASIGSFCQTSHKNYDIYLYKHDLDDLQWLSLVSNLADKVLLNEQSKVTILNLAQLSKFGSQQEINTPLEYLQQIDNS